MLKVFTAQHQAEAHLVEDLLRSNGIEAHVIGDSFLNTAPGPLPFPGTAPEVWILNSDQAESAFELIQEFSSGQSLPGESGPSWQCPKCSEIIESQFTACWKCGTSKPSNTSPV
jgi:predicted RNA-binding Zn-ribbon protein involved in translation (DUF1610 family)